MKKGPLYLQSRAIFNDQSNGRLRILLPRTDDISSLVIQMAKLHEKLTDTVETVNRCYAVQVII